MFNSRKTRYSVARTTLMDGMPLNVFTESLMNVKSNPTMILAGAPSKACATLSDAKQTLKGPLAVLPSGLIFQTNA